MRTTQFLRMLALGAITTACASDPVTAPPSTATAVTANSRGGDHDDRDDRDDRDGGNKRLTVMTRNLYLGALLDPVIGSPSPQLIPIRVAGVWAQVQQTNFPERARALAREIAAAEPELVGLQEVSLWRSQFPGDAHTPGGATATQVEYDFLEILLRELRDLGQRYEVVSSIDNFDAELFYFTGTPGASLTKDIRLTDRDVILKKHNLTTWNARAATYAAKVALPVGGAGGPTVSIVRGWTSVDAKFRGESFRFFNTHLEVDSPPFGPVQVAQGNEAVALLAASPLPVIAVGDYNSPADGSATTTYATLIASGFTDVFAETNLGANGFTAGMSADLLGPVSLFQTRVDLVLTRGPIRSITADVVGNRESDRTPSGLMPSDHAGLVATVKLGGRDR